MNYGDDLVTLFSCDVTTFNYFDGLCVFHYNCNDNYPYITDCADD